MSCRVSASRSGSTSPRAARLKRFYEDLRGTDLEPAGNQGCISARPPTSWFCSPASNGRPNGEPHVPGNLEVWKQIVRQKTDSKTIHDWNKHGHGLDHPEQLLDAMVAFSRVVTDSGPLQIYLTMCEIDSGRAPGQAPVP